MPEVQEKQDSDDRLLSEEEAKMYFEYFKHISTLNVATAVVVLAIYQEAAAEALFVGTALVLFALSLVLCVINMSDITGGRRARSLLFWYRWAAGFLFIAGSGAFVIHSTGLDRLLPLP